jgi:amino acid permease
LINSKRKSVSTISSSGNTIISFLKTYKHALLLLYLLIYFPWFYSLEATVTNTYTSVHIWLDDLIPFNELFIIPYYLWFIYIVAVVAYLLFNAKEDYYKCCAFLFIGMTVCLTIYTIWPNGQDLRPTTFARDNFLVDIVKNLYRSDTSTNVCPSIHVFNSIGVHIAIMQCSKLKDKKWVKLSSFILCILICMSTAFLKQHSVFDGICAIILCVVMYIIVYVPNYSKLLRKQKEEGCQLKKLEVKNVSDR